MRLPWISGLLDAGEQFAYLGRQVFAEDYAEQGVELIDIAHGGDARRVLGGARSVTQAGGAGIAGARVDFREAVSHGYASGRAVRRAACAFVVGCE